jgi:putative tricarboxylic transport membrane protein
MRTLFHNYLLKRDFYAGGLMVLLGIGTVFQAQSYKLGTLTHMGPGFFPTILGIALVLIGIMIAGSAAASSDDDDAPVVARKPEWFAWACIIAGPLLFVLLGQYAGMAPAIFACVFVSALGDRSSTYGGSFILAVIMTVFGVALFSYVLRVPFPIFRWVLS